MAKRVISTLNKMHEQNKGKVNLSSTAIELSLSGDANKLVDQAQKSFFEAEAILKKVSTTLKPAMTRAKAALKIYDEIDKKANELGISPKSIYGDGKDTAQFNVDRIEKMLNKIK